MTWWKAIYDTKTPTWSAYGRVAFVQAETETEAQAAALLAAQAEYPGVEILPVAIGQSTPDAAAAFAEKRRRLAEWQANVKSGHPNSRATLESAASSDARLTDSEAGKAIGSAEKSSSPLGDTVGVDTRDSMSEHDFEPDETGIWCRWCKKKGDAREHASRTCVSCEELRARLAQLEGAIRSHRDARGDDRCWRDDDDLYRVLPEGYEPPARDTSVELERCRQFITSRQRRIEELEARPTHLTGERDEAVDTYTPILWATFSDEQQYEEYIRVRQQNSALQGRLDAAEQELKKATVAKVIAQQSRALELMSRGPAAVELENNLREQVALTELRAEAAEASLAQIRTQYERLNDMVRIGFDHPRSGLRVDPVDREGDGDD